MVSRSLEIIHWCNPCQWPAHTGIPEYRPPIEQGLRCPCGKRYVVYLGGGVGDQAARARDRAAELVDAREVPFMRCECGELLDFTPGKLMQVFSFDQLDETRFEEFCYDLLGELGFINRNWRKLRGYQRALPTEGATLNARGK